MTAGDVPPGSPGGPAAPARDPGLQPERTALAWQRTGLALLVAGLVVVRHGLVSAGPASLPVVGLGAAAGACGLLVVRRSRTELAARVRALVSGEPLPAPTGALTAAAGVLLLAVATVGVLVA